MQVLAVGVGLVTIVFILVDAFEAIILPRRVTRRLRLERVMTAACWHLWVGAVRRLPGERDREGITARNRALGIFGPLMLLVLIAFWAGALIIGLALVDWGFDVTKVA